LNIQNIPKKDIIIKKAFLPKLDMLLFFDYKQIEARLLAFYMQEVIGDDSMVAAFKAGLDLHEESAKAIHQKEDVSDNERDDGKTFNFSIIYGGGIKTLIKQLGCSKSQALKYLRLYHERWPGIKHLQQALEDVVADKGYFRTLWGRRLRPQSPHKYLNGLCQGCAADLIKWANVEVAQWQRDQGCVSHLVCNIHDELMADAIESEASMWAQEVPKLMVYSRIQDIIPIEVDVEYSTKTWADKEQFVWTSHRGSVSNTNALAMRI
jgi:DNA polymerase-1